MSLDRLLTLGLTYIDIDLSKGVCVTGWHKKHRHTFYARAVDVPTAVEKIVQDVAKRDSSTLGSSLFEDLLG